MKYRMILGLFLIGLIGIGLFIAAETELDKAEKNLKDGIQAKDLNKVKEAVSLIVQANTAQALEIITKALEKLPSENAEIYWSVLKGLDSFNDPEAIKDLAEFILKNKNSPLGRDTLFVLKSNTSPNLVKLLAKVLKEGTEEMHDLALDHLTEIRDKDSVEALIAFLKGLTSEKDKPLRKRVINILIGLTGQSQGDDTERWAKWWEENKNNSDVVKEEKPSGQNTGTAVDQLGTTRMMKYNKAKTLPKEKIVVVTGECYGHIQHQKQKPEDARHDFDRIELILEKMNIPHTKIPKYEFDKDTYKLNDKVVIIFNCNFWREHCVSSLHMRGGTGPVTQRAQTCVGDGVTPCLPYASRLSDKTVGRVKAFIENGGYVFTEDWELEEVLEGNAKGAGFQDRIGHIKYYEEDKDVSILPAPGAGNHPYLRGVFERVVGGGDGSDEGTRSIKRELRVGKGMWKIDKSSPDIKVVNPKEVTILLVSPDLKKDPKDSGVVAVTFGYGRGGKMRLTGDAGESYAPGGRVLHVLSHFGKQTQKEDEFVLQNILLNFIMEAADRWPAEKKK